MHRWIMHGDGSSQTLKQNFKKFPLTESKNTDDHINAVCRKSSTFAENVIKIDIINFISTCYWYELRVRL